VRLLAFYLPQFHAIPENDRWWGKGFTEWTNVAKAKPLFPGHYQPHLPADLGFYDLRLAEVRDAQAEIAGRYGISGFCYYHYWFNGRRLLNRPFDAVLQSGAPDFPFCLCWANESWTRRWDGADREVLLAQEHSLDDDRAHIEHLMRAFADPRYIRVDGRPLFLVYRTELLPDPGRSADIWRERALAAGIGDLYLARVESFAANVDPKSIGFDAAVEFAPDWRSLGPRDQRTWRNLWGPADSRLREIRRMSDDHRVYSYGALAEWMLAKESVNYKRFRCVTPGWDNSPRRPRGATVFHGSTPRGYETWLRTVVAATANTFQEAERFVFVNAWNEWGEGNHLEPDQRWGLQYLEATARAATRAR
jgi:lipopolysaccharide biosynthesis protein